MALPELGSSFGARLERTFDGVPGLVSYLIFTSLQKRAPALARGADLLARRRRGRFWLVGEAATDSGPVSIAHLGSPDRLSRWFLDRLGVRAVREDHRERPACAIPSDVEIRSFDASEADDWARAGWLVLPRYVHHRQHLGDGPSAFELGVARRARKQGLTLRVTRAEHDLDEFQRVLYDPMLERRHGPHALRTGRALLRLGQRRGGLLLVHSGGRAVAGAVAAPAAHDATELEIWALGVARDAPGDAGLAAVLGWVSWARERQLRAIDHVASLPLYSDGLTRQKLRWGTALHEPATAGEMLGLSVHGKGPAVRSFLSRHSFAARSRAGIVRVDVTEPEELARVARALVNG